MISITQAVLNNIFNHAQHDLPFEACGYLVGINGLITKSYALVNADHSSEHFSFEPGEQFATVKNARNEGLEILANYHSHPATPARPSIEDIHLAYDPDIYYFIISLAKEKPDVKAFRIKNGDVEKIDIEIIT
jgi:[CysO sulfur-carrier protein]-S-L-cysteine hydrolase